MHSLDGTSSHPRWGISFRQMSQWMISVLMVVIRFIGVFGLKDTAKTARALSGL